MATTELLTADEKAAITKLGEVATICSRIVAHGKTRNDDFGEIVLHIHNVQHAIMSQAAARAYPTEFRLLGGTLR